MGCNPRAPSTDIALVDKDELAAFIGSSYGGGAADADALVDAADCEPPAAGACCDSRDGPVGLPLPSGRDFSPNGDDSNVTFDMRSAACSVESARFSLLPFPSLVPALPSSLPDFTLLALPTLPGPLGAPSILLIPNAQRSRCEVDPNDEDGEGRGCEPVMNTDSERGVWLPPRPREGGTPTSRVGGGVWDADCAASSAWMTASTSSMLISTFSGFKSTRGPVKTVPTPVPRRLTSVDDATTAVHIIEPEEDLLRDLLDDVHWHALVLVALDQAEQVLAQHLENHANVRAVRALVSEVVEEGDDVGTTGMGHGGGKGEGSDYRGLVVVVVWRM